MNESVVVVTGGGRGIGRAICQRFASSGARIVAAARSTDELEETKTLIEQAGGCCETHPTDVSKSDDIALLVETTTNRFGRIDVLINNAGVAELGTLEELSPDHFESMLTVNVKAVYYGCRAVWPIMRKQGGGVIINTSSAASSDPFPGFAAYGASKAWVNMWTKALSDEGKPLGIRIFAVAPGAVETKMLRGAFPDFPADQALTPKDVAEMFFMVAQPDCRFATGQTIFVKR